MDMPPVAIVQQVESRSQGTITRVDGAQVTVRRDNGREATYTLIRNAEVYQDGRAAQRDAVRAGRVCRVVFDPATLEARFITLYVNTDPPR